MGIAKTRIVEYRDGNNRPVYRIQFRWCWLWINYSINTSPFPNDIPAEYRDYDDAKKALTKALSNERRKVRKKVRRKGN